jgi:hypothetical protein
MSEDYVADLTAVRTALIQERRRLAASAAETDSLKVALDIKEVQESIDAVDRAITDEEKNPRAVPPEFGSYGR